MKDIWGGQTRNPELRGYTGRIFEREVLGECRIRARGRVSFWPALGEVFRNQPGSPFEPTGETANLYDAVRDRLCRKGFHPARLELYTAVGSALDEQYGIDGFFRFEGVIVTLDCTLDSNLDPNHGRRVIITGEDFLLGYPDAAEQAASVFQWARTYARKGVF
jgi:hypothetical protein